MLKVLSLRQMSILPFSPVRDHVMADITQISAKDAPTGDCFSVYGKPYVPIATDAQKLTRICFDKDYIMTVNGEHVSCIKTDRAIGDMLLA